ncbi:hypothetical protein EQZ01_02975 [Bacillus subtilis]|uniref:hypothetical protein n=1 Tax=Bacillus subtilis TaxID=1423 RepID=UPI000FFE1AC3|nr:hypothetical protein [Bacillus subtilis]QAT44674.1 hypothetical protein EQZ01_02975 [Bacillus subtilis]CAF1803240.1 hypothetical protein NRS6085_02940 [Bacillus subtilis]CAI6231780.1 hypothetical protein NRS6085_03170 [Bacillus subtilis]
MKTVYSYTHPSLQTNSIFKNFGYYRLISYIIKLQSAKSFLKKLRVQEVFNKVMSRPRAVISDQILFNECISTFRPQKIDIKEDQEYIGYLLLDFHLNETLNFRHFSIEPSIKVEVSWIRSAFISPVKLPKWFEWTDHPHLFSIALAAVFSFASGRPVKAPRDLITLSSTEQLDETSRKDIAVQFPVVTAGTGAHNVNISSMELNDLYKNLQETIDILFNLSYKQYTLAMQTIRLVHLAHMNKRDDFGLAYYLLVSSLETFSTAAIKKSRVSPNTNPDEEKWKRISEENNGDFAELFNEYIAMKKKDKLIGKRFIEFILEYCPPKEWNKLKHPNERMEESLEEQFGYKRREVKKHWSEKYPEDLTDDEIRKLLKDLYTYRSNFTHRGENPPYRDTDDKINKFFLEETIYKKQLLEEIEIEVPEDILLPNYSLISFIANQAITKYLKKKLQNQKKT